MAPQNVSSNDDYTTQYEWTEKIPTVGQSVSSKTFLIKNTNNYNLECSIAMKLVSADTLQIRVKKGYYKPAKAVITITLGTETPITTFVEDWKDVHRFTEIPQHYYASYLPVNQSQSVDLGASAAFFGTPKVFGNDSFSPARKTLNFNLPLNPTAIKIVCTIKWLGFIIDTPSLSFQKTFENFYLKPMLSDLEIKIGNYKLPAHRIILITWSKKFAMELATDVKSIELADIDVDTLKEVLWYMYSGEMKPINDITAAAKILAAAINYDIIELKVLCIARLLKTLSTENALQILEVAYEYKVVDLYQEILIFIKKNKKTIGLQKDLKNVLVNKPELMYEFMMLLW